MTSNLSHLLKSSIEVVEDSNQSVLRIGHSCNSHILQFFPPKFSGWLIGRLDEILVTLQTIEPKSSIVSAFDELFAETLETD